MKQGRPGRDQCHDLPAHGKTSPQCEPFRVKPRTHTMTRVLFFQRHVTNGQFVACPAQSSPRTVAQVEPLDELGLPSIAQVVLPLHPVNLPPGSQGFPDSRTARPEGLFNNSCL